MNITEADKIAMREYCRFREDSYRLDWLEENESNVYEIPVSSKHGTLREFIDKAMGDNNED